MKLLIKICVFVLTFIFIAPVTLAQSTNRGVNNYTIESFRADYYLNKDENNVSQLKVVENITALFPAFDQNHGIERALPKKYEKTDINLKVESVKRSDGSDWKYSTTNKNNNQVLRIGDPDKYVQGTQQYIITYTVRDVIKFYDEHDEWYWDTNGDQWQQQFGEVSATLYISNNVAREMNLEPKCFTGAYGKSSTDCIIEKPIKSEAETTIVIRSTKQFQSSENMSFVLGFKSGTFEKYKIDGKIIAALLVAVMLLGVLLPLLIGIFMYKRWKAGGKDPEGRGTIIAQYSVPKEINLIVADVISSERMQVKAISATLIDLCVKGYLRLYEIKGKKLLGSSQEYEVELLKSPSELQKEEQKVITMIFDTKPVSSKVNLKTLQSKLYKQTKELSKMAYESVVTEQYFESNPEKAKNSYIGWGVTLIIFGTVLSIVLIPFSLVFIGLIFAGVTTLIFSGAMPKRTQKGVDMKEYLLGLKVYMKLAEADRIKFLQGPETAKKIDVTDNKQLIKLYEKLLPYAVLYGIEKNWAKQFAGLYGEGQSPDWYNGHSAFNAVLFSNAISGFGTATTSSFSPPSSSGSSGYSGGGGFSGGGGGGGGGGGW